MKMITFFSLLNTNSVKKFLFFIVILTPLIFIFDASAATLYNNDSQSYQLEIRTNGGFYEYTIIEQTTVSDICNSVCEIILKSSGQTIKVNPNDIVIIENGLLQVTSHDN